MCLYVAEPHCIANSDVLVGRGDQRGVRNRFLKQREQGGERRVTNGLEKDGEIEERRWL